MFLILTLVFNPLFKKKKSPKGTMALHRKKCDFMQKNSAYGFYAEK